MRTLVFRKDEHRAPQRHDGELREATDEDIFGTTQHDLEIIRRKGQQD